MDKITLSNETKEKIKEFNSLGYEINFYIDIVETKIFGNFPMHYAEIIKDGVVMAKHAGRKSYDEAFDYALMVFNTFYKST